MIFAQELAELSRRVKMAADLADATVDLAHLEKEMAGIREHAMLAAASGETSIRWKLSDGCGSATKSRIMAELRDLGLNPEMTHGPKILISWSWL